MSKLGDPSPLYPPRPYRVPEPATAIALMRSFPFAHFMTAHGGLRATRLPFIVDCEGENPVRLRGHLDARNPQAEGLDGAPVLVDFSGPSAYVSPHWRADKSKGGTYDYEEVQVRGSAQIVEDVWFFRQLIDDLSSLIEPQHSEIGDYPVWDTSMAPDGHLSRQFPLVRCFTVEIDEIATIAKLHQNFPAADRRSVAEHLARSSRDEVRAVAERIRSVTDD
jgi:transcriptional regulator